MAVETIDLEGADDSVIALRLNGKLSGDAMSELLAQIEAKAASGKVRLFIDIEKYDGFELDVVREKLAHFSTLWNGVEKCVYLVDQNWMLTIMPLVDAVTPMHVRAFAIADREAARTWLLS